jgi:glucokinase
VGLALPGIVDERTGTAITSSNLGWRDVPFGELARERTGLPVAIGHDVRAGGLAEAVLGAGRGVPDFLFLPIGTGVAAAMILDGELYRGPAGWAGELGHVVVRPEGGESCFCGRTGCLEAYASAAAIVRRHGDPALSAEEVIALAESGDPRALRVWTEALDALATAIDTYTMLLDPSLVVVGGGLGDAGATLLDPLAERLATTMTLRPAPPLTTARLGSRAAVLGAAILARRLLEGQA